MAERPVAPVWSGKVGRWIDKFTKKFIPRSKAVKELRYKEGGVYDHLGRYVPHKALQPVGRTLYTPARADFFITYTRYDKDIYTRTLEPNEFVVGHRFYRLATGEVVDVKARFPVGELVEPGKAEAKFRDSLSKVITGETGGEIPEYYAPRTVKTYWVIGRVTPIK
ncbi:MAG: hypothetical protein HWN68_11855 [Desulfobacterales bacterium]|nr:hypothetical protein [Desulfobacterales bacterium]